MFDSHFLFNKSHLYPQLTVWKITFCSSWRKLQWSWNGPSPAEGGVWKSGRARLTLPCRGPANSQQLLELENNTQTNTKPSSIGASRKSPWENSQSANSLERSREGFTCFTWGMKGSGERHASSTGTPSQHHPSRPARFSSFAFVFFQFLSPSTLRPGKWSLCLCYGDAGHFCCPRRARVFRTTKTVYDRGPSETLCFSCPQPVQTAKCFENFRRQ